MKKMMIKGCLIVVMVLMVYANCNNVAFATSLESDFEFSDGEITEYLGKGGDVVIPSTIKGEPVTKLKEWLFHEVDNVTTITIPDSVTYIGINAFRNCLNLEAIHVDVNNSKYSSTDGILFNKDQTELMVFPPNLSIKSYTIPENVTTISGCAFEWNYYLETVYIPDTVTSFGNSTFRVCISLKNVRLPDNLRTITDGMFSMCSSLENIELPNTVLWLASNGFSYCTSLKTINIPEGVTYISSNAFHGCSSLTSVTIPDTVESIYTGAFKECIALESVIIPNSVTNMGSEVFRDCSSLKAVIISESLITLSTSTFYGCSNLDSLSIPKSITLIESNAFCDCTSLQTISIPKTTLKFESRIFENCSSLNNIYYEGTMAEWYNIDSHAHNDDILSEVSVIFNSAISESALPSINVSYTPLPSTILYTSYLTTIPNMSESATLVSGSLPRGLGIYPDGSVGGIPTQEGTFQFVVNTSSGEEAYSITVQSNTTANVEADNDFTIIERIPTIDNNESDHIFEVSGEYSNFLHVYLDGELLIRDVDYTAEEGSTKITISAQTFAQLDEGSHTINATFAPTSATVTPSTPNTSNSASSNVTVQKVAHTFDKIVPASTTIVVMPFSDVTQYDWFYSQVLFCYKDGTFSGVTETTYEPNTGMTRAMMAVVLHSLANKPSSASANFSDVADGEWYANAVNWLSQKGIDDSYGTFRPTDLITREETAKMLYNFCTDQGIFLPLVTSGSANDIDSVSENVQLAVTALFQRNIFGGDEFGNFNPEKSSTRAEISTVMKNFMSVVM